MDIIIKYYFQGSIPCHGKRVFKEHNDMVRTLALEQRKEFLEFQLGDGWEPLCKFLGKDVPDMDFPHVNDTQSWRRSFRLEWSWKSALLIGFLLAVISDLVYRRYTT